MATIADQEVQGMLAHFADLKDPRSKVNQLHLLGDIIVISICGVLAGADGPTAIGKWAKANEPWLRKHLALPNGVPSHDVIRRVLATVQPQAFQKCFVSWLESLRGDAADDGDNDEADEKAKADKRHISIDGKALRRSHDRRRGLGPLQLVAAWANDSGITLGQLATEEKSNEITAIPELLEQIDVKGAVVTIDAMGCQKEIAQKIVAGGGDFVLALKGNHRKLFKAVRDLFFQYFDEDFAGVSVSVHEERDEGHGRCETRTYYQVTAPSDLPGFKSWANLKTIGLAIRVSVSNGEETVEMRYYISSLRRNGKQFARYVRGHWGIENTLHWSLDMTFREDESRTRGRRIADNLAWLRRMALSLLKQHPSKDSLAMKRRLCGWSTPFLLEVLTGKAT